MEKNVIIAIPYYTNDISEPEKISLMQIGKVFANRKIVLIIPQSLEISDDDFMFQHEVIRVEDECLSSRETYNKLMLSRDFYSLFVEYKYVLICQLDVLVFYDNLDYFIEQGYDYYGAPWLSGIPSCEWIDYTVKYVGNGGFSLRNVQSTIEALRQLSDKRIPWEDYFFSSLDSKGYKIAPLDMALKFAFEWDISRCLDLNNNELPMAIHAWWRFDYNSIKCFVEELGYSLNAELAEQRDFSWKKIWYCLLDKRSVREGIKSGFAVNIPIYIWGAGNRGYTVGWILKKIGIGDFAYFDNDIRKRGTTLHQRPIFYPEDNGLDFLKGYWILAVEGHENAIAKYINRKFGVSEKMIISFDEFVGPLRM